MRLCNAVVSLTILTTLTSLQVLSYLNYFSDQIHSFLFATTATHRTAFLAPEYRPRGRQGGAVETGITIGAADSDTPTHKRQVSMELTTPEEGTRAHVRSAPSRQQPKDKAQHHQPQILPLLDWELQSMSPERKCAPPLGIPQYCCIGTYSIGGSIKFTPPICNSTMATHERLQNYTHAHLSLASNGSTATKEMRKSSTPCDVCRVVDVLIENLWTLAFQGDSVTRQTFVGLECELRRRGYGVDTVVRKWDERPADAFWKFGISETVELTVRRPQKKESRTGNTTDKGDVELSARIVYYAIYRPYPDNLEVQRIIDDSDIVVFDHGLHWNPHEQGEHRHVDDMTKLLQAYVGANLTMVAWRQTSSQHNPTPGGHWFPKANLTGGCQSMDDSDTIGYHWQDMVNASESVGLIMRNTEDAGFLEEPIVRYRRNENDTNDESDHTRFNGELVVFPYREYTIPLHYMHPSECTHYCSTPYIWLPIWHSLRLGMERSVYHNSGT